MTLRLQIDAERVVSQWLRDQAEVSDIADDRVLTVLGRNQVFPACRVTRIGGSLIEAKTYVAENALMQFDCWGGPKAKAWLLAETIRAALIQRFNGEMTVADQHFVGSIPPKSPPGGLRIASDTEWPGFDSSTPDGKVPPAKPRVSFDATVTLKPLF